MLGQKILAFAINHGRFFKIIAFHPMILTLAVVPGMSLRAPTRNKRLGRSTRSPSTSRVFGCWHPGTDAAVAQAPNVTVVYSCLAVAVAGPVDRVYKDITIVGSNNWIKALLMVYTARIALLGSILGAPRVDG